jgi:hypothetical protein
MAPSVSLDFYILQNSTEKLVAVYIKIRLY